jgi:hypothetical protein
MIIILITIRRNAGIGLLSLEEVDADLYQWARE